jgi:L-lactate dehydrogenase complex protein LldE
MTNPPTESKRVRVALFVTCLVDIFRPTVGFAAAKLLEDAGCEVDVPAQTCCGQPAYNGGDASDARELAKRVITAFETYEFVVAPSGSCAGMMRIHYPRLFENDPAWSARAEQFAAKIHELFSFLVNVRGMKSVSAKCGLAAAYHDSCSSLREMGVAKEPRLLLSTVEDLRICELSEPQSCCGFGGFFAVKYPEISARMADDKIADVKGSGAQMLIGADLGCLMHLAGRLARRGEKTPVRHAAEVLAGYAAEPGIGEDSK